MDSAALQTAPTSYVHRCNWMGCPQIFNDAATLRAHVINLHFEPATFIADCRVPGGRWQDWRRAHDADYSFNTDSWVDSQKEQSRLVTPEQHNSFTSFGALDTPIRAGASVEASPSLSILVRRTNGSSLPASPQLETPSPRTTPDESPRKRCRISPHDGHLPTFNTMDNSPAPQHQDSLPPDTQDYAPELDDSFPEFLPSDDIYPHLTEHSHDDLSLVESQASSSADVELQLTPDDPAPPDTSFEREHVNEQGLGTLDDSLTEPESPTQDQRALPIEVVDTIPLNAITIPAKRAHSIADSERNADAGPSTPPESTSLHRLRSHSRSPSSRPPTLPESRPQPRRSSRLRSASPVIPSSSRKTSESGSKSGLRKTRSASLASQAHNTNGKGKGRWRGRTGVVVESIEEVGELEGEGEPEADELEAEVGGEVGSGEDNRPHHHHHQQQDIDSLLEERYARIVPPLHFDMDIDAPPEFEFADGFGGGEEEDSKDGILVDGGGGAGVGGGGANGGREMEVQDESEDESRLQLISQAPYNYDYDYSSP